MAIDLNSLLPRYSQLTDILREEIKTKYRAGERFPSQNDLIKKHSVSYGTVIRALNELIEEGWIVREQGRGTFVRNLALAKNPGTTATTVSNTLGVIMPGYNAEIDFSPFMADIGKYLIKAANSGEFNLQFLPEKVLTLNAWTKFIKHPSVNGIICFNPTAIEREKLDMLSKLMPLVFSERLEVARPANCSWCEIDNTEGIEIGMRYLAETGHRRMAVIIGDQTHHPVYAKRLGVYQDFLRRHQLPYRPELVYEAPTFSETSGRDAMAKLWEAEPDAVFITSASFGIGALKYLNEQKIRIPDDISVIGYDDQLYFAPAFQQLTTIEQPVHEFAGTLVEALIQLLATGKTQYHNIYIKPFLRKGVSVKVRK